MSAPVARVRSLVVTLLTSVGLLLGLVVAADPASAALPSITNAQVTSWTNSMLALMNQERALYHLVPLTMDYRLQHSARAHDRAMTAANTMSHQLPGEASVGTRIRYYGYNWRACAENIGWNTDGSLSGLLFLQKMMFNEKAPNDGHRLNILNPGYRQVGIDIYFDYTHQKMWMTQDFGRLAGT